MVQNHVYGKYRGKVVDNRDPLMQGRIRANLPALLGKGKTGWALPAAPYGGNNVGFFFIPPVGANVWIEFEAGNTNYPIWSGCFWATGEVPGNPATPDKKIIKTDYATIVIDDAPLGKVTIETSQPAMKIVMDPEGIELSNASSRVKITKVSVSVNDGALEVV